MSWFGNLARVGCVEGKRTLKESYVSQPKRIAKKVILKDFATHLEIRDNSACLPNE